MLPPEHRLRRSTEFSAVVRRGRRAGRGSVTVHVLLPESQSGECDRPPRAGLVVSKAVGGSVVRHRTARRLRHLLRSRLTTLPASSDLVVRASARAGTASSAELGADLDAALRTAARAGAPVRRGRPQ